MSYSEKRCDSSYLTLRDAIVSRAIQDVDWCFETYCNDLNQIKYELDYILDSDADESYKKKVRRKYRIKLRVKVKWFNDFLEDLREFFEDGEYDFYVAGVSDITGKEMFQRLMFEALDKYDLPSETLYG